MRDAGWFFPPMKTKDPLPNRQVGSSKPFPLAQILQPRLRDEGLYHVARVGRILKDAPADGPISQPHPAQSVDGLGECRIIPGINLVVDRYAHRSIIIPV